MASYGGWIGPLCLGTKPGQCWTGVSEDADLLGSEMENKRPSVGMKRPSGRGEPKAFLFPISCFGCAWIIFMEDL